MRYFEPGLPEPTPSQENALAATPGVSNVIPVQMLPQGIRRQQQGALAWPQRLVIKHERARNSPGSDKYLDRRLAEIEAKVLHLPARSDSNARS